MTSKWLQKLCVTFSVDSVLWTLILVVRTPLTAGYSEWAVTLLIRTMRRVIRGWTLVMQSHHALVMQSHHASSQVWERDTKLQQSPRIQHSSITPGNTLSAGNYSHLSLGKDVLADERPATRSYVFGLTVLLYIHFFSWQLEFLVHEQDRCLPQRVLEQCWGWGKWKKVPPNIALGLFSLCFQLLLCSHGLLWLKDCAKHQKHSCLPSQVEVNWLHVRQPFEPNVLSPAAMFFPL